MKVQTNFRTDIDYSNDPCHLAYARLLEAFYGFTLAGLDPNRAETRPLEQEELQSHSDQDRSGEGQ